MLSGLIIFELLHVYVANGSKVLYFVSDTLCIYYILVGILQQHKCLIKTGVLYTRTAITLTIHCTSTDHYCLMLNTCCTSILHFFELHVHNNLHVQ